MTRFRTVNSIRDIAAGDWNRLANPPDGEYNPLISHAFFLALEVSGSATRNTGWLAQHLVMEEYDGITGVVPCYLKSHSYGEYVFDHAWADAYRRAGGAYYPKLQVSVPFTPVTGRRLMAPTRQGKQLLVKALEALCVQRDASSAHITFLPETELGFGGWTERTDIQFHWFNAGYADFGAFLQGLASRKRKNIRKERQQVLDAGITHEALSGSDLKEHHWDAFFDFYQDTGSRKWGSPYLTRKFFSLIGQTMAKDIVLILAKRRGRYIAGALNFMGSHALYGRNWGAVEHHPFLHFETCYYQAIEYAIARKLDRVEAGAQGPHKLARGYLPSITHSLHYFADARLGRAVAEYLAQERTAVAYDSKALAEHSPFKANAEEDGF
jgi:predicted N-acyltransferase